MRIRITLLLAASIIGLTAGPSARAQSGDPSAPSGTVYFYYNGFELPLGMFGPIPSIAVLVDGAVVATIKQRTYLGVRLAPGRHAFATKSFRTDPKDTTIQLDIAPGEEVFIRLDMVNAGGILLKWTAFPRIVGDDEGRVMVAALQPLDARNVADRARATTEPPRSTSDHRAEAVRVSAPLPEEAGIFVLASAALQPVTPEVTTFRATSHAGLTAVLKRSRSLTRLETPLEFVIRCPDGTTAEEYVLLQLMTRGNRREYRTLDGGKSFMRQGPDRMAVPFESRRIGPNTYYLKIPAVPRGEYGWILPGGVAAGTDTTTVTYTFGVD